MFRRILFSAFSIFLVLTPATAGSKWDRYRPATLHGMLDARMRTIDKQPGLMTGFPDDSASIVRVIYLGDRRAVPSDHARLYTMCGNISGMDQDLATVFKQEILVREDTRKYWLPVQDVSLPDYDLELKANDEVDLYVILIGIDHNPDGTLAPLFLVNEFRKVGGRR